MFNALQPGVFALSGWDLVGALTLDRKQVAALLADGDTRWIHRSAYDLMDYRPDATESLSKMPRGTASYGSLPEQLADPSSFARRLREILAVRKRYGIATGDPARRAAGVEQGDAGDGAPARATPSRSRC